MMKIAGAILFSAVLLAGSYGPEPQENPPLVICCAGDSIMRPVPVHLRPLLKAESGRPFQVRDWAQGGQSSETYPAFLRQRWENWKTVRPERALGRRESRSNRTMVRIRFDQAGSFFSQAGLEARFRSSHDGE